MTCKDANFCDRVTDVVDSNDINERELIRLSQIKSLVLDMDTGNLL